MKENCYKHGENGGKWRKMEEFRSWTESSVHWGSEQASLQGDEKWYWGRGGEGLQGKDQSSTAAYWISLLGSSGNGRLGQILAGRSWEVTGANFCYLAAPRPPIEFLSGIIGKRPFWAKSWPGGHGRSWEVTVGYGWLREVGFWAAIEFLSWDQWETAVLSQILAGRSREVMGGHGSKFLPFGGPSASYWISFLGSLGNSRFGRNPGQEVTGGHSTTLYCKACQSLHK